MAVIVGYIHRNTDRYYLSDEETYGSSRDIKNSYLIGSKRLKFAYSRALESSNRYYGEEFRWCVFSETGEILAEYRAGEEIFKKEIIDNIFLVDWDD